MTDDTIAAWAEQRERNKLWKLFEDWCVYEHFAYRQDGRIWFHRNGGDGMWEAFQAGASIALRDHPKAHESLEQLMTHAYGEGRKDEREAAIAYFEKVAKETEDQSPLGKAHCCRSAAQALREGMHS